jgi:E3 Ubiquitin ligase
MKMLLIIGVILLAIGIVLFFVQKNQKTRSFCIKSAQAATTGELKQMAQAIAQEIGGGDWREYVKVMGMIHCDRPLISPLKQEPCVHYSMTVKREYEEKVTRRDSDGKTRQEMQRGSEVISSNQESVPFLLKDRDGEVLVKPDGADIETVKVLDEFRQEQATGGLLSFGKFSLTLGNQLRGGDRRTLGYHYSELILPIDRQALVVATAADDALGISLQKPSDKDKRFIISLKTYEELTKAADQNAKNAYYGMIACLVGGVILIILGLLLRK